MSALKMKKKPRKQKSDFARPLGLQFNWVDSLILLVLNFLVYIRNVWIVVSFFCHAKVMDFFGGSMVKWQAQLISGHFVGDPPAFN